MALTLTSITSLDPPARRDYSFTDHSNNQPSVPLPGDRLDAELDRIYRALRDVQAMLAAVFAPDGTIAPHSITLDMIDPDALAAVKAECTPNLTLLLAQVQAAAANTLAQADQARAEATRARLAATEASALLGTVNQAAAGMAEARAEIETRLTAAETEAVDAENFANDAEESAIEAKRSEDLSGAWAEYLEGGNPIPSRFFAHTEVTGDHWSSRWWANKAAAAFGQLSELYLGVWPSPPTTTSTGDPIPIGAIYYNSTLSQVFIWNGSEWQPFWAPSKAYTFSLIYRAAAGQTEFPLTEPDLKDDIWTMTPGDPEILEVFVNGVRLLQTLEWVVDNDTSTVTFTQPLLAGTMVLIDILVSPNRLAPGRVSTLLLLDFDIDPTTGAPGLIDGTRTVFHLARASDRALVPVSSPTDVQIFIDGGVQKPGLDYNTLDDTITFAEAPLPGATAWGILFSPEIESTTRAGDRAEVVTYKVTPPAAVRPGEGDLRQRAYATRRRVSTEGQRRPNP